MNKSLVFANLMMLFVGACVPQKIVETVVVEVTRIVEVEVTRIVAETIVEVEVVEVQPTNTPEPTGTPKPDFTIGGQYWTSADLSPWGAPSSWVDLINKPSDDFTDPSVAIVGILSDASPVTLIGIRDDWCLVGGTEELFQHLYVEGWLKCSRLLSYEPTPLPTIDMTPESP